MFTYVCLGTNDLERATLFYDAALGALVPGLRPQYNPDFYAAYLRDPDGNKIAAVCRGFTGPQL